MTSIEPSAEETLIQDAVNLDDVINPTVSDVMETVTVPETASNLETSEVVIPEEGGEESSSTANTAAVMQSIIEALTNAASETAALGTSADNEEDMTIQESDDAEKPEDEPDENKEEDPNGIAAAAAALQVLATKASSLSPGESIAELQQVLQQSLSELPGTVASLVNEVASEVVVMAKAAQHATMAAESMIENEPEKVKKTKRGKLKIHKCSECGKGFTLKVTLMRHLELHTREIECEHCTKVFFSPVKLANHIKRHHTSWAEKERSAVCSVCNKGFYNNSKLKVHMRVHTGERPYACSFCEKSFQCSSHCKRHERLHTGEHPYVCETCGKGFGSPSNLKDHAYTHTKETPYKCNTCGRGFAQWGALQRHIAAIHEKKKDCKCEECGKCFARKDYLRFHIQKCHWHKCGLCKMSFEHTSTFQQHVKNCNVIPESTPRKRLPQSLPGSAKSRKSPRKRPATEPRPVKKRPLSMDPTSTETPRRKRRHVMTPAKVNTDLLSVYDQFDDDPLADPDYEAFEDLDELEGEEIVEEEGVQMEEILEQEEISQLEDIATGEIKIVTRSAGEDSEEPIVTGGNDEPLIDSIEEVVPPKETHDSTDPVNEGDTKEGEETSEPARGKNVSEIVDPQATAAGEDVAPQAGVEQEGGEATIDSLVNALMSAAELQTTVQPDKEE